MPLCVPVLIGHDIRSILFASRFPSGFFLSVKSGKILNFRLAKDNAAASLYNPTVVILRYR
ncbi:conserved hypothetical protein [Klebsiella pneumoniae]|nr:conserved hypothetical protein [Klebsiella pneumoniae]